MARGKVGVRLRDKRNNCESIEVPIEDFIYHPYEIEFRFPGYVDEYEVIVKIHNKEVEL